MAVNKCVFICYIFLRLISISHGFGDDDYSLETEDEPQTFNIENLPLRQLPTYWRLKNGFLPGSVLNIAARTPYFAENFVINFKTRGENEYKNPVICHVSIRFHEDCVVLNTFQNGIWGTEKRVGVPITPGEKFCISINSSDIGYEIRFNGAFFALFEHRIEPKYIEYLQIYGDIEMSRNEYISKVILNGRQSASLTVTDRIVPEPIQHVHVHGDITIIQNVYIPSNLKEVPRDTAPSTDTLPGDNEISPPTEKHRIFNETAMSLEDFNEISPLTQKHRIFNVTAMRIKQSRNDTDSLIRVLFGV